jgi:hypothetical protein
MEICFRVGYPYDFGNPQRRDSSVSIFKISIVKSSQLNIKFQNKSQYRRRTKINWLKNYYKVIINTMNYHRMCRYRNNNSPYYLGLRILWSKGILSNQRPNRPINRRFKSALVPDKKQIDIDGIFIKY